MTTREKKIGCKIQYSG